MKPGHAQDLRPRREQHALPDTDCVPPGTESRFVTVKDPPEDRRRVAKPRHQGSLGMHDGSAVWCDCCSCEMEPCRAEVASEMGIDVYHDYKDNPE